MAMEWIERVAAPDEDDLILDLLRVRVARALALRRVDTDRIVELLIALVGQPAVARVELAAIAPAHHQRLEGAQPDANAAIPPRLRPLVLRGDIVEALPVPRARGVQRRPHRVEQRIGVTASPYWTRSNSQSRMTP